MARHSSFLRSASLVAVATLAVAGCAAVQDRHVAARVSIKDDPVDVAPAKADRATRGVTAPVHKTAARPAARLTAVEPASPPVKVASEQPPTKQVDTPKAATLAPRGVASEPRPVTMPIVEAKPTVSEPKPVEVRPVITDLPKSAAVNTEVLPQPPRAPVEIKPINPPVAVDTRPTVDQRRKSAEPLVPPRNDATPSPSPSPAATQAPAIVIAKATEPKIESRVATLSEEQRVATVLGRAETYMKAGRYQDARTSLEDAAKSGNSKILVALAETYDPLILREQYPRLNRTGDPEKAIAAYERAKAAGARDLDGRLAALKAAAGAKR